MKTTCALLLSFFLLAMPSCGVLTPQQRSGAQVVLDDALSNGEITPAQHAAASEALAKDEPYDWEALGFVGINLLLALVGGPVIVRKMRGPPTQKVGIPASKIKPTNPPTV